MSEQEYQEDQEIEVTENVPTEGMKKFASANKEEFSSAPRRSFVKGDIRMTRFSIGENGDVEVNNVDKHGNAVYRDRFGNVKCISNEDLEAGLVPDLEYQEKYKMQQHTTQDGEVRASVSLFQDAFYDELEKQKVALAGKTMPDKRKLPTGKKVQENASLPALKKTSEVRQAFDQYGRERNHLETLAESIKQAREREERERAKKQETPRAGMKILCGSCDKRLDSAEYAFCPYCGAQL